MRVLCCTARSGLHRGSRRGSNPLWESGDQMSQTPEADGFTVPEDSSERCLWMQSMTGLMLMTRVRQSVITDLPADLGDVARAAACKAVDDTLYSLMMLVDGIFAPVRDTAGKIGFEVDLVGRLVEPETGRVLHTESLHDGEGACAWLVGWLEGDYEDLL